jgi:hypothetical protein
MKVLLTDGLGVWLDTWHLSRSKFVVSSLCIALGLSAVDLFSVALSGGDGHTLHGVIVHLQSSAAASSSIKACSNSTPNPGTDLHQC